MIQAMQVKSKRKYSMEEVYRFLGTSRQAIKQSKRRKSIQYTIEAQIVSLVKDWRKTHPMMGSREMYHSLVHQGKDILVGINKFEAIVSKYGLNVGSAKTFKPMTSDGRGKDGYSNLTNKLNINDINQLIVGDITYFDIKGKWHYIFTLKDVYSQNLLGLIADRTMRSSNLMEALAAVKKTRGSSALKGCIHHSDNGSQYNSTEYKEELLNLKMKISRAENCQQNGSAEQLNHIIKNMYLNHWSISSLGELKQACRELQYLNNHQRTIKQLGHKTPHSFEKYIKTIPSDKRVKKQMYDFNQ